MKGRNLFILVVAAAALVVMAVITSQRKGNSEPDLIGAKVLPDLPINDVEKIVIRSVARTTTVAKAGGVWSSPDKYGYAVQFEKVRDALRALGDLKVGQVCAIESNELASLDLLSPLAPGATTNTGALVELYGSNGVALASLLVGKTHARSSGGGEGFRSYSYPDGRYIRRGEDVIAVSHTLDSLVEGLDNWLDKQLVNVQASDVVEVSVSGPGRQPLRLRREKEGEELKLEGLKANEEMDSPKLYNLSGALSYLDFTDVANPALSETDTGMANPLVYAAKTKDGQTYTLKIGGASGPESNRYVRLAVAFEPPAENAEAKKPETEAEKMSDAGREKAKEEENARAKKRQELASSTIELNEKLGKWVYVLAAYKADSLAVKREDLVKEKKEEKKEEEAKKEPQKPEKRDQPAASDKPAETGSVPAPKDAPKEGANK